MYEPNKTQSGTYSFDGIEYNEYPPPSSLLRATEKRWAEKLIKFGEIKLNSLEYIRSYEDLEIGDKYEGEAEFILNGNPMHSGTVNKVYTWSCSLPTINKDALLSINKKYDTIICITNLIALTNRCIDELNRKYGAFLIHLGLVQYNRGNSVSKKELNSPKWLHNVFQKRSIFAYQKEYRMAFTDLGFKMKDDHLILEIGSCGDIINIEYEV